MTRIAGLALALTAVAAMWLPIQGEATTLPYKQMSLPRTATVVITPNGDGSAIADSSSVVRDLSKAHSLSKARRHKEAEQILRKWVDSTDIGVDLLSSALLIQFYGRFQGSDPSSGSAKELLVTLAELDTQDELWDKVRKTKRLTGREWYYRRGRGTCHAADVASMELRSAEQLDRNDQDVAAIAEFNEKVSAVTRLLELCVSMPASSQEYRKWLFWNYFNHEYDLASGTPVCPPKLEAVTDQLTDLGIADADLINRAAQVLQFCARSGDAVNLLRKQLSFMRIVRSDAKMRELYRKPVLEGIVQLALALLQQGEFQESIAICEQFKTKIASCTDVLVNAYSFSDQYADAVLIMHQREIFKHAQNDTDRFESGQLLADVVNQWKWNVGVRSQAAFAKHKEQKRRLEAGETFESPQNFALEGFASPDSASGGWSALRNDKLATSRCNIEKVHVDSIDPETWRRDYMSFNRPVILQGALQRWPALQRWRRDAMLERFGNSTQMRVRKASTIAADNIATHAQRISKSAMEIRQAAQHIPLREFLEKHMPVNRTVDLTTEDPMYILDRPWASMWEEGDYPDPLDPWFSEDVFSFNDTQRHDSALMYIGPVNAGTQFHAHSAAWNALVFGERRWFLMENYAKTVAFANVVYDEVVPITGWMERYYAYGQHLVLECMQQPGDIIFVPHGYMHAVVNTKDSIGIANQIGENTNLFNDLMLQVLSEESLAEARELGLYSRREQSTGRVEA